MTSKEEISFLSSIIFRKSDMITKEELRTAEEMIDNPEYGEKTCPICSGFKTIAPEDKSTRAIFDLGICSNHARMELYKKKISP
jgi:hypothetical protein